MRVLWLGLNCLLPANKEDSFDELPNDHEKSITEEAGYMRSIRCLDVMEIVVWLAVVPNHGLYEVTDMASMIAEMEVASTQ